MTEFLAQVAPQRATQYAALASHLAPVELQLCPLGHELSEIRPLVLGGQEYLRFDLPAEPDARQALELGMLAMTSSFFAYYERLGDIAGPLLRPIDTPFRPALPAEMVVARRYRGKTNELFTHFLCNLARFSSGLAQRPWWELQVFDPLAGGGTALFVALMLGADAAGVERNAKDVETTSAFLLRFMRERGIACKVGEERLRGIGRRWVFTIGKGSTQRCILAHGDTGESRALISGFKPDLIVADLPYGIQHRRQLDTLLAEALPVWASLLSPRGAMALAWESTRLPRAEMVVQVESAAPLTVLNEPPYDQLAHRVDRVIKQRDVIVARQASS